MELFTKSYKPKEPIVLPPVPPVPKIVQKVSDFLQDNDHMCQRIYDGNLTWCQKDECEETKREETKRWKEREKENEKQKQFGRHLKQMGHTCVVYGTNCFPMDIAWCENEHCTGVTFYPHGNAESCCK